MPEAKKEVAAECGQPTGRRGGLGSVDTASRAGSAHLKRLQLGGLPDSTVGDSVNRSR